MELLNWVVPTLVVGRFLSGELLKWSAEARCWVELAQGRKRKSE